MKRLWRPETRHRLRANVLAGTIVLQAVCSVFFIGDVIEDVKGGAAGFDSHSVLEALAAVALLVGVIALMVELRQLLARMKNMDAGLKLARGEFSLVLDHFFAEWNLTGAERDVALMMLKGLDNKAIAGVRNTAEGTVRAQATRIYSKSGVDGRAQFVSLFMEELFSEDGGVGGGSDDGGAEPSDTRPEQSAGTRVTGVRTH